MSGGSSFPHSFSGSHPHPLFFSLTDPLSLFLSLSFSEVQKPEKNERKKEIEDRKVKTHTLPFIIIIRRMIIFFPLFLLLEFPFLRLSPGTWELCNLASLLSLSLQFLSPSSFFMPVIITLLSKTRQLRAAKSEMNIDRLYPLPFCLPSFSHSLSSPFLSSFLLSLSFLSFSFSDFLYLSPFLSFLLPLPGGKKREEIKPPRNGRQLCSLNKLWEREREKEEGRRKKTCQVDGRSHSQIEDLSRRRVIAINTEPGEQKFPGEETLTFFPLFLMQRGWKERERERGREGKGTGKNLTRNLSSFVNLKSWVKKWKDFNVL